jgi:pilus assembly protein CpaB
LSGLAPKVAPPANPYKTVAKTIAATDLPAAADFAALDNPSGTMVEGDDEPATAASPVPLDAVELPTTLKPSGLFRAHGTPLASSKPSGSFRAHSSNKDLPARPSAPPPPVPDSGEESAVTQPPLTRAQEAGEATSIRPTRVPARKEGAWRSAAVMSSPARSATIEGLPMVSVAGGSLLRKWRPFAIAGVFLLIAVVVAAMVLSGAGRRVRSGWHLVPVVVAATDLPEGTAVTLEMVSQRSVPEQFVTSSVIKPESTQYVVSQKILVPVQAGDPLLWSQFESARASERLSKKVFRRMRAYDVATAKSIAVGGWIQPNDRVDVIVNVSNPDPNRLKGAERVAVTVLENITVLSTGKITSSTPTALLKHGDKDYVDVSLLLIPEEAELLALANDVAEISFTLRNEEDHESTERGLRTTSNTLLQGERVRLFEKKRFNTIQMIRATRRQP